MVERKTKPPKINPKDYQSYMDVIKTDQMPAEDVVYWLSDLKFRKWYFKNENKKATWEK